MNDSWLEEYIACDCHSEGLMCSYMPEGHPDAADSPLPPDFVYLSLWSFDTRAMRWRDRLRLIWQILRKGDAYRDEVALDKDSTERLRHFCDMALQAGVYDRPWVKIDRAGEVE